MLPQKGYLSRNFTLAVIAATTFLGPLMPAFAQNGNSSPVNGQNSSQIDGRNAQRVINQQDVIGVKVQKPWANDPNYLREVEKVRKEMETKRTDAQGKLNKAIKDAEASKTEAVGNTAGNVLEAGAKIVKKSQSKRGADWGDYINTGAKGTKVITRGEGKQKRLTAKQEKAISDYNEAIDSINKLEEKKLDGIEDNYESNLDKAIARDYRERVAAEKKSERAQNRANVDRERALDKGYKKHLNEAVKDGVLPMTRNEWIESLPKKAAEQQAGAPRGPSGP